MDSIEFQKIKQIELFTKYPELFEYALMKPSETNNQPITLFNIECWKGWSDLIKECSEEIHKLDVEKVIRVCQIKQKFAGLRYYITWVNSKPSYYQDILKITHKYESFSYSVCEACGAPGSRANSDGYILTLCDDCLKKEQFSDYRRTKTKTKLITLSRKEIEDKECIKDKNWDFDSK